MTQWLTVPEAAEYVRAKHDRVIRQAVHKGDLPAYFYGMGTRDYRLKAHEVDAWMESRPYEPQVAS
jgi:excisionase family DNA binding protein